MNSITLPSPAKINLTLDVKAKKAGAEFHELDTIYHLLNWGDELTVTKSDKFELEGNFDCATEDNLIYKAWQLLDDPQPVKVQVIKHIPTGAGLGGGSSNAATFIKAYFKLFELGAVPTELVAKLGTLGKDIPLFFAESPCCRGTGYGETIEPLDLSFSGTPVYLYIPEFKHPTAWAYGQLKNFDTNYTQKFLTKPKPELCDNIFNQLIEQNNYSKIFKDINTPKIHLCGSGSVFFSFKFLDIPQCRVVKTQLA